MSDIIFTDANSGMTVDYADFDSSDTSIDTITISDPSLTITGDLSINGSTSVYAPYQPITINQHHNNSIIIGECDEDKKQKIYICELWQTKKPIDLGDGLIASFPEDMLSEEELKKKVYNKIEELHPDKAIKLGLNEENISLRKNLLQ